MDFDITNLLKSSSSKNVKNEGKARKAPSKVVGETKTLDENIKLFKAKKEAEEKQKKYEASQKKQNLLALRAEDKKSSRAANSMLKMAKSANRSAIDEARNHRDTSTTLAGRNQCDNDDYGYESNAANSIYDKLMNKYEANPEDPMAKFARSRKPKPLVTTGDPKFQPFRKPESSKPKPEATTSASQRPSTSSSSSDSKKSGSSSSSGSSKSVKKVNSAPPPPSFAELMKMAKNKKNEPQAKDLKPVTKNKEGEFDRPMTAAQKEEFIRERDSQLRKAGKLPPSTSKSTPTSSSSKPSSGKSETKKNGTSEEATSSKNSVLKDVLVGKGPCKENNFRQPCMKPGGAVKRDFKSVESRDFPGEVAQPKKPPVKRDFHSVESRPFPGEAQPKSKSRRDQSRSPSPPMQRKKSGSSKSVANRIESDSEEYDSEMDDFIDDSDCKMDVSAEIAKMFGYDRRKYRNEDDFDDRSMENNRFSSIMKEEAYSAKEGRREDLEDMKREEEENRKKAMRKKQKGGGGRSRY